VLAIGLVRGFSGRRRAPGSRECSGTSVPTRARAVRRCFTRAMVAKSPLATPLPPFPAERSGRKPQIYGQVVPPISTCPFLPESRTPWVACGVKFVIPSDPVPEAGKAGQVAEMGDTLAVRAELEVHVVPISEERASFGPSYVHADVEI
jgi:hypothetical protein